MAESRNVPNIKLGIKELPFMKTDGIGPLGGKPIVQTPRDLSKALTAELKKEHPNRARLTRIALELEKNKGNKVAYKRLIGPILFLQRMDGTTTIHEKVPGGGTLSIVRSDGKEVYIHLPWNKATTFEYGGERMLAWIANEMHAIAYPYTPKKDSRELRNIINGIVTNHANLDDIKELMEKRKIIETIMFGIVIIIILVFIAAPLFGVDVFKMIAEAGADKAVAEAIPPNVPAEGGL